MYLGDIQNTKSAESVQSNNKLPGDIITFWHVAILRSAWMFYILYISIYMIYIYLS